MRIASPPTTNPCFYGVDTPDKDKLLAARLNLDIEAMRAFIKALRPWVTGKLQPSCNIVRLHGEEAEHLRDEIIESATEEFK